MKNSERWIDYAFAATIVCVPITVMIVIVALMIKVLR